MSSLTSLGLTAEQAVDLVSHKTIFTAQRERGAVEDIFDASDREEGGDVIIWWNDLEKDQMYARWSDNIDMVGTQEKLGCVRGLTLLPRSYFVQHTPGSSTASRRTSSTLSPLLMSRTPTASDLLR